MAAVTNRSLAHGVRIDNGEIQALPIGVEGGLVTEGGFSGTDAENQPTTPLGISEVWTGTWKIIEQHGCLIFLYAILVADVPASVQLQWSDDESTIISTTTLTREDVVSGPFTYAVYLTIQNGNYPGKYARPKITNDATAQVSAPITLFARNEFPFTGSFAGLDSTLTFFSRALLVRAVQAGVTPAGGFTNIGASGTAYDVDKVIIRTTTPLLANGVYTSGWIDTNGWDEIELVVGSDVVSASDGIQFEFTEDVSVAVPVTRTISRRSYTASEVASGSGIYRSAPRLSGFRVVYTNGGTPQGSFFLEVVLQGRATALPQAPFGSAVSFSNLAVMTRAGLVAPNDAGAFANVQRGLSGGLDIGIIEHEVETPIKSLSSFKVARVTVTAVPALVFTPDENCRSWTAKAITSSGKIIFVAENIAKATTGAGFPLQNAEWVGGDLAAGSLYACSDSGTQALAIIESIL